MKLLLDAGALIDAKSCNGGTPLMRAIETSQKTIIKQLLERGWVILETTSVSQCPTSEINQLLLNFNFNTRPHIVVDNYIILLCPTISL